MTAGNARNASEESTSVPASRVNPGRVFRGLAIALVLGTLPGPGWVRAEETQDSQAVPSTVTEARVPGTGTIEGKVLYKKDPARPWRLGRYYIKNAKTGALAEAVVALSRRGLKGLEDAREPLTWTVDQKDFQFTPETVAVRVGDQVRFLNSDAQTHNVRADHLQLSFNVNMPPGGEHVQKFPFATGIQRPFQIGCVYHGAMRAWIFVFDHPWFQLTGTDGAFRLTNVPPGEYRLDVVHPAGELSASQTITVKADETVSMDFSLSPDHQRNAKK